MPLSYVRIVAFMAVLMPALALTTADGGPAVIYLGGLVSLIAMGHNAISRFEPFRWKELTGMAIALLLPLLVMFINSAYFHQWSPSEYEKLLRFALGVPMLWVLLRAPKPWLRNVQWSMLFSALAGAVMLVVIMKVLGRGSVSEYGGRYNAVAFADLTLLFGMIALISTGWTLSPWPRLETWLKVLICGLTLYATWVSQTRSSWMLLPVFSVVLLLSLRGWTLRSRAFCALALVLVLGVGAAALWSFSSRMHEVASDVKEYTDEGQRDTSVGIRMQLWQASWLMFREHPVLGVGGMNFRKELARLRDEGKVTPLVASDYGEPHNDFLGALAGYGSLGLLSFLALYLIPAGIFLRRMASTDRMVRVGAQIGLLFCLGYGVFSLTEMMFRNMRSVPIYSVTVVVLIALTSVRSVDTGRRYAKGGAAQAARRARS